MSHNFEGTDLVGIVTFVVRVEDERGNPIKGNIREKYKFFGSRVSEIVQALNNSVIIAPSKYHKIKPK